MLKRLYLIELMTLPEPNIPIVCYLIQADDGTNMLVDSGFPLEAPYPKNNLIEQLALIGLQPADINLMVGTHFDVDHAGNFDLFPNAELVVQKAHYEDALTNPRYDGARSRWQNLKFRLIEGDFTLIPGVDLIETSGHAIGHQSVLVRLPETGAVLLTIDAVPSQKSFVPNREPGSKWEDRDSLRASTAKLMTLAETAALVVFGHDTRQWQTLRKLPEAYT